MKKFLIAALATLALIPAQAQLVHSTTVTKIKQPSKNVFYLRVGPTFGNATGEYVSESKKLAKAFGYTDDFSAKVGFDVEFGGQIYFGRSNWYYNFEIGFGTSGYQEKLITTEVDTNYYGTTVTTTDTRESLLTYDFKLLPLSFGYCHPITSDIKIDAHLGLFYSVTMGGSYSQETEQTIVSPTLSSTTPKTEYPGDWSDFKDGVDFNSINVGLQLGVGVWYKRFNLDLTWERGFVNRYGYLSDDLCTSNLMLRLGIGF